MSGKAPMNYKIIAVGGTGQMVLHYFLQLYLLGEIDHTFEAVVVDTDKTDDSIEAVRHFLGLLQYGSQESESAGSHSIPSVRNLPVAPPRVESALQALTGRRDIRDVGTHPAQAFFDRDTLGQNLMQGLFARPALSSVISQEALRSNALRPHANTTVVVTGSVLGGTGGGLMAPIMDSIRARADREDIDKVQIRAVLFGEYFTPDPGVVQGDVIRFKSNQTFVLCYIQEVLRDLHSFYVVGGPGVDNTFKRKPEDERKGEHIAWPERGGNPFWRGAEALEYMLVGSTKDKPEEFYRREVEHFESLVTLERAQNTLRQRLSLVETLIRKRVVVRMSRDPWARAIWGTRLTDLVAHYWSIAAAKEGAKDRVRDFPDKVQDALRELWDGGGHYLGLRKIFPNLTKLHAVRPENISKVPWPRVEDTRRDDKLFEGADATARRLAALLVYWGLRTGV